MHLVVSTPDAAETAQMAAALRAALPRFDLQATVGEWQEELPADPRADYGVGWKPSPDFFPAHPNLKAFFNAGAGLDHLLNNPAMSGRLPGDLPIIRLEDAGMGQQMSDYCRHQVLDWMYGFSRYRSAQARGAWVDWDEAQALTRSQMTIGVLGLGVLGRRVAQDFAGDGFTVLGHARQARAIEGVRFVPRLGDFLAQSRVLILLVPSTASTHHLLRAETLALLPRGAFLINIARGALVNEGDLLAALDQGHLAGACLDVFGQEPLPPGHRFWQHPKVRVTPHISGPTLLQPAVEQMLGKLARLRQGLPVSGLADRSAP